MSAAYERPTVRYVGTTHECGVDGRRVLTARLRDSGQLAQVELAPRGGDLDVVGELPGTFVKGHLPHVARVAKGRGKWRVHKCGSFVDQAPAILELQDRDVERAAAQVAFSILNMPDGSWHWVMRLWEHGLEKACTIHKATRGHQSARGALDEAARAYSDRERALAPVPAAPSPAEVATK